MINQEKWINSLTKNNQSIEKQIHIDHDKWVETIPKKNTFNSVKRYSLTTILFIFGLMVVSIVKNETRNIQKEINSLEASISVINFNLDQAILDHEVITSPENISLLAKENLNNDLSFYKSSQIVKLDGNNQRSSKIINKKNKKNFKNLPESIKINVAKKIDEKKTEIRKLQALYHNPKSIPDEIKKQVAVQIKQKQTELKNIYDTPDKFLTYEKIGKWSVIQVVKVFFGMPVIPGR